MPGFAVTIQMKEASTKGYMRSTTVFVQNAVAPRKFQKISV